MKLISTKIRKVRGRDEVKVILQYRKDNGKTVYHSLLKDDKPSAQNYLKFRLAGLSNGGKVKGTA